MGTLQVALNVFGFVAAIGLVIFTLYLRARIDREENRARSHAGAVEKRLVKDIEEAHSDATDAVTELQSRTTERLGALSEKLGEVDKLAKSTEGRTREAELGLAGIKPQLENVLRRIDEVSERLDRCATRDDIARVLGKMEEIGNAVVELRVNRSEG